MADYTNGENIGNRLYVNTNPLYIKSSVPEDPTTAGDLPKEYAEEMSNLIREANGEDDNFVVNNEDILKAYNQSLDDLTAEQTDKFINEAVVGMAERGVPAYQAVEWANAQKKALGPSFNSGAYTQAKDRRLAAVAENDPVIKSLLLGGSEKELDAARLLDKMQTGIANYQIVYNKMIEASNVYDEQGVATKIGKGYASGATIPFIDNINARRISGKLKDIFGESFGDNWNVNTLYEKTRDNLMRLSQTLDENKFKDVVNTIDEALLDTVGYTYGDRQTFWQNVYNQNYRLNNAILAGEFAGVLPTWVGVGSAAVKAGGGKAALKAMVLGAANDALPGSGIAAVSLNKVVNAPVKFAALKGQRKLAGELAAKDFVDSAFMNMKTYSEQFNAAGRSALENTGSGLSKPFVADAAIDISKTNAMRTAQAVVSSDSAVDIGIQRAQELTQQIINGNPLIEITRKTKSEAENKFVSDVVKNLNSQHSFVHSVASRNDKDGFVTVLELGRNDGNKGFATLDDAKLFAGKLNITSDDFLNYKQIRTKPKIVARSDGYYVQLERSYMLDDGNIATLGDLSATKIKKEFADGVRNEYSGNALLQKIATNTTIPHYIRTLNNAYQLSEGRTLELLQGHLKNIKSGSGPVLDSLMDVTRSKHAWIKSEYLAERNVPQNIIKAYEDLRLVEDVSRMLDGQIILRDLEELGMKNVFSNGKRIGLGRYVDTYDAKKVNVLVDYDEASGAFKTRPIGNDDNLKDGYSIYEMQRSIDGSRYIAISNKTLSETNPSWSNTFLSYEPGRRTFSRNSGFIKQAQIRRENGKAIDIEDVHTIFSHPNQESVKKVANTLEEARRIAIKVNNGQMDLTQAERLFNQLPDRDVLKFSSFDEFYGICGKDNLISLDPEASLIYVPDGGKLPETIAGLSVGDHNRAGISMLDFSNSENIIKKTMRKNEDVLNPFTLTDAPRVSIDEELGLEVKRILNSSTVDEYTRLFADDFAETFRPYLKGGDPRLALTDPTILREVKDTTVKNMMENAQHTFARMKSQPTEFDTWMERVATGVANWFAPGWKSPEGSNRLALYKSLTKASPTKMLRAYGFHFNLGMWNPRQFYAQAAASINAMELSPKAAAKITPMYMPIIGYMKSGDKSLLARIAKSFGVKQEYLDELVEGAKRLDIWSKGSFGGAYDIAERGKGLWDNLSSTWFYDSGEHVNRLYTGLLAVQEQLDKGISVAKMTPEQILQVVNRQQNLYLNMSRAGSSELQRGALGVFTQFRGYQMRALELMFDKTLTAAERSRFLLSTMILGGTKGVVGRKGAAMIHSFIEDKFNVPEYASQVAYNGALDQYVLENGGNVSLGEFFNVSFGDLWDMAVETNPPSYSAVGKTVGGLATIFNGLSRYGRGGESTPSAYVAALNVISDMARKGQLPGGAKNAALGLWAYHTGERLSGNGQLLDKDLSTFDSTMIALGFRNVRRDIEALAYQKMSDIKDREADFSGAIKEMMVLAQKAPTEEMRDAYTNAVHVIMSDLHEENPMMIRRVLKSFNFSNYGLDSLERTLKSMLKATGASYGLDQYRKDLQQANERTKEK